MNLPTSDELAKLSPAPNASLTEIQEWMALLIRHKRGLAKSEAMRTSTGRHFSGNDRLTPAEQIDIYRQQFWLRHTNNLVEDFPGVTRLLGQKLWEKVAEGYLTEVGYDAFALRDLGKKLPAYLKTFQFAPEDRIPPRELLVDMACIECAYSSCFDVADDPELSQEKLAAIPPGAWPGARFQLSHSLRLLKVSYPVAFLRRELKTSASYAERHPPEAEAQNLVVYRRTRTLWDKALSLPAFSLLEEFQKGTPLVPACEAVVARLPEAATVFDEQLVDWFTLWGQLGWITDVLVD